MTKLSLKSRIEALEQRVAALEIDRSLEAYLPAECQKHQCSYFTHYLAYGGPELTHEGFHSAEKHCEEAQKRVMDWMEEHPEGSIPRSLLSYAENWERRVRA